MSPREMHQIEKAALDDPFLADAMEGYQMMPAVNIKDDIEELQNRLQEKTSRPEKTSFIWWKVAAILLLVLGASTTAWWLNRPGIDSTSLAKNEAAVQKSEIDSSVKPEALLNITDTGTLEKTSAVKIEPRTTDQLASSEKSTGKAGAVFAKDEQLKKEESIALLDKEKPAKDNVSEIKAKPLETEITAAIEQPKSAKPSTADEKDDKLREMTMARQQKSASLPSVSQNTSTPTYYFRGLVTDEQNKPVPYASVRISQLNNGTYTDVLGRFSIVASDSVLTTDIVSVGYSSKKITLFARTASTIVRMEPSSTSLSEVVVTKSRKSKETEEADSSDNTDVRSTLPYAEPTDGWSLFEIYIRNNLRIPVTSGPNSLKGTVIVSFYVDPINGRLSDLRIEKSLGIPYDKEAIRVLKDGPTWDIFNTDSRLRAMYTVIY